MPAKKTIRNPFDAAKTIYEALETLDTQTRQRVLTSALSLLGMSVPDAPTSMVAPLGAAPAPAGYPLTPPVQTPSQQSPPAATVSLENLMKEKAPATNAQRLAVFAYYREKREGLHRFARRDLEEYFARARLRPAENFDRDFKKATQLGYIHEDGAESYLTSKGVEAVEAGFGGKFPPRGGTKNKSKAKKPAKKARGK
jgi:hypothetical protein